MKPEPKSMLKFAFVLGAVLDGAIAISWFLIASGLSMPNILNGYTGVGADYQLAMCIAAMFMGGWAVLLAWGAMKPMDRSDLLLITSVLLLCSVIIEYVFFSNILGGDGFVFGVSKRLFLIVLFSVIYFNSRKTSAG